MIKTLLSRYALIVFVGVLFMLGNVRNGLAAEPVDEAAFHRNLAAAEQLPFSFVYSGKPSADLLGKWKRTVEEKAIDATKVPTHRHARRPGDETANPHRDDGLSRHAERRVDDLFHQ